MNWRQRETEIGPQFPFLGNVQRAACVWITQAGEFNWNCKRNWNCTAGREAFNQAQPPMQPQIIAMVNGAGAGQSVCVWVCVCAGATLLLWAWGVAPAAHDLIGREICKSCVINSCVPNCRRGRRRRRRRRREVVGKVRARGLRRANENHRTPSHSTHRRCPIYRVQFAPFDSA